MNGEMGISSKLRRLTPVKCLRKDPRGARHWGVFAPQTSHEGGTVKGRTIQGLHLPTCRSVCRIRGSRPFVDCGFDARRTSHSVAVHRAAGTTIPHS
jgi:hypothetical protein